MNIFSKERTMKMAPRTLGCDATGAGGEARSDAMGMKRTRRDAEADRQRVDEMASPLALTTM
jgi:hypothetical protein